MDLGIDVFLKKIARGKGNISDGRLGILTNSSCADGNGTDTISSLLSADGADICAIFAPEHGLDLSAEDMEGVKSSRMGEIPIFSLYGDNPESLSPTHGMMNTIDILIIDLPDIGSRYYTYVWTAMICLEACAKYGKRAILLDRPNPIGGIAVEGGGILPKFNSFVGAHSIPVRHGMTIGEILSMLNDCKGMGANIDVVKMKGWKRHMHWPDTKLEWRSPSPNMKSYEAALLYAGMCLIEGTNISEGRGTETPFEHIGAPYIDGRRFAVEFNALGLAGVEAEAEAFTPKSRKWAGQRCEGIRWHITDARDFNSYLTGLAAIWLANMLYSESGFEWMTDKYEFVRDIPAIDLLTGSDSFRRNIGSIDMDGLQRLASTPKELLDERTKYLLY